MPSQRRGARRRRPSSAALQARTARTTACSTRSGSSPPARCGQPVTFRDVRIGLPICEDIWFPHSRQPILRSFGAELLLVPNGSPFEVEKLHQRLSLARERASETGLPLVYVNQVGGQDELVFDGGSFVVNGDGALARQLPLWHGHRRADAMEARKRQRFDARGLTNGANRRASARSTTR